MKTAILKTNLWDDDTFYELNIDTKLLYLLLMSSPERGVADIYSVSDRILSARSGLNEKQLNICKKQLQDANLVMFKDKYIKLVGLAYVLPKKGRFTEQALERELAEVPQYVLDNFTEVASNSSLIVEHYDATIHKDKDNNKDNNKDIYKDIDKDNKIRIKEQNHKDYNHLLSFWSSNGSRKLQDNKTSKTACIKLLKEHSVQEIEHAIMGAIYFQGKDYKPQVLSFSSMYDKWDNLTGHMQSTIIKKDKPNATAQF